MRNWHRGAAAIAVAAAAGARANNLRMTNVTVSRGRKERIR